MARKKVVDKKDDNYSGNKKKTELDSIHRDIIGALNKSADDVSYIIGEDNGIGETTEWLSTGSTILDMIISNNPEADGGVPVGKLTEISGENSTGKSMLAYLMLKDCIEKGGVGIVLDTEYSMNVEFLRLLGINPNKNNFIYKNPQSIEEVFDEIENVAKELHKRGNPLSCIIWDSVAATSSDVELEEDNSKNQIGIHARAISKGLRKTMPFIGNRRIALVFLNQLRVKVGIQFGDPHVTPGGKAIPYSSSVRLRLFSDGKLKVKNDVVGVGIKPVVHKTRFGPPHRDCHLKMYFQKGLIDEESWMDVMKDYEIVEKISAQKSSYTDKENGEVHEFLDRNFVQFIKERPELREKIRSEIKQVLYKIPDFKNEDVELVEDVEESEIE